MTNRFPSLAAAAREIAYDNGMVNRHRTEAAVVGEMLDAARRRYSLTQLDQAEAELRAHIAAGRLNDVCCGGSDSNDNRETPISTLLDEVLNEMFEPS